MWPLKTIFYFLSFWALCGVSLINPIFGVVNYVLLYHTFPKKTWWGEPLATMGIRFSLIATVFLLLGMLFRPNRLPRNVTGFTAWEGGVALLVVFAAINLVIGVEFGASAAFQFDKFWKQMVFVLILARMASTRGNLHTLLWALVLGTLYIGHDAYTAPKSAFAFGRLNLIGGPDFSTTSGAAAHLTAMLPLIGAVYLTARKRWWKVVALASGGFAVNAIILCRTRSAFVGLAAGIVVAVLLAPRKRRYRIYAALSVGLLCAFALTDGYYWDRMGTLTDQEALNADAAAVSRAEINVAGVQMFFDHPLGVGVGNFSTVIGQYDPRHVRRSSHNSLLVCFAELGIQGGLVYLVLVIGALRYLYMSCRLSQQTANGQETRYLAYGMLVSLVTYSVIGLGTQRFYCESYWWVLTLPLCLYRSVLVEARSPQPALALRPVAVPAGGWSGALPA